MTDDEWYTTYCGEKAALFGEDTKYKADAIFYRSIVEAKAAFRSKVKSKVKATREAGNAGPLTNLVHRLIGLSHPRDWLLCDGCGGKGHDDSGEKCNRCYGSCYSLRGERY